MSFERRIFLSVDAAGVSHADIEGILGFSATWVPGDEISKHPQLRVSPDWPIKEFWRAYAPLITHERMYEIADPEADVLIFPPKPNALLSRLREVRAHHPEVQITLHVMNLLCEGDTYASCCISPEVMAALSVAGVAFNVTTHYDLETSRS